MRDWNSELNYRPYEGGAGPSEEQTKQLADTLFNAATAAGFNPERFNDEEYGPMVRVDTQEVGYDRWGYCDDNGELDQADLNSTMEFLRKHVEVAS